MRFQLSGAASIVALVLSLIIFHAARRFEDQSAQAAFRGAAQERLRDLEMNVDMTLDDIVSLGAFFDSSHVVERNNFARFSARLMHHDRSVQALAWIPRVPGHLRSANRRDGASARELSDHFPILFIEPSDANGGALGFDLASDPALREALWRSAESGRTVATGRVVLLPETTGNDGFLVFRPYYRGGTDPSSTEARRDTLAGFVLGVFRVKDVVESKAFNSSPVPGLGLVVFDHDAPPGPRPGQRLLYPKGARFDSVRDLPKGPIETGAISLAGRTWDGRLSPSTRLRAGACDQLVDSDG